MRKGYARLINIEADLDSQIASLKAEACATILAERESGPSSRQRLDQFLYDLEMGDELILPAFETLGRSTGKLVVILHDLLAKQVVVRVLAPVRVALGAGPALSDLDLLALLQRHEAERMAERYNSGRGSNTRKRALTQAEAADALARLEAGESMTSVAKTLGVEMRAVSQAVSGRRKLGESLHSRPGRQPRTWITSLAKQPPFELACFPPAGTEDA